MRKILEFFVLAMAMLAFALPAMAIPAAAAPPTPPGWLGLLTQPGATGPIVLLVVQLLKVAPIPFTGQTRAGLLAALTLVAIAAQVAVAVLAGQLDTLDLAHMLPQAWDALLSLLTAAGVYSLGKRLAET